MIKMREKQEERDALKQLIDQTNLDKIVMIEVENAFDEVLGKPDYVYADGSWLKKICEP